MLARDGLGPDVPGYDEHAEYLRRGVRMRGHLAFFLLCCMPARFLMAQTGETVTVREGVPGGDIFSTPADMQLVPKAPKAHPGEVWVRSTNEGLQVWGKVQLNGDGLYWPIEKSGIPQSDHVEIWLSAAPGVEMPVIGYGNQFDQITLKSAADCYVVGRQENRDHVSECQRWFKDQAQYRKLFEKLFTRHWVATKAPNGMKGLFEDYATPAWADLKRGYFEEELPTALEPHGSDGMVSEFAELSKNTVVTNSHGEDESRTAISAYTFHFFVPWSAFPPTQQLSLRDLWLTVDVFRTAYAGQQIGAVSTTSSQRIAGKPLSFNHLVLDQPRDHQITPCRATGAEMDLYGASHRAWFFPMAGNGPLTLTKVYDVENPAAGYMYDPNGLSPAFRTTEHFWKELPDGATICGPQLTYLNRGVAHDSTFKIAPRYLETKTLPDGWMLVRTGPDMSRMSAFGAGQCGSCPVADLHIYAVSPQGQIFPALDLKKAWGNGPEIRGDFDIASDWSRITAYEAFVTIGEDGKGGKKNNWTATSYCLTEHAYQKCGEEKPAKPPNPPKFDLTGDL